MGDHLLAGISLGRSLPRTGFSALGRKQAGLLGPAATVLHWAPMSSSFHLSLPSSWPYTKPSSCACTDDAGLAGHTRQGGSPMARLRQPALGLLFKTIYYSLPFDISPSVHPMSPVSHNEEGPIWSLLTIWFFPGPLISPPCTHILWLQTLGSVVGS